MSGEDGAEAAAPTFADGTVLQHVC
eukprot:COSAG06_NODE_16662_length_988_cov_0.975253_1_plen_24_part_10